MYFHLRYVQRIYYRTMSSKSTSEHISKRIKMYYTGGTIGMKTNAEGGILIILNKHFNKFENMVIPSFGTGSRSFNRKNETDTGTQPKHQTQRALFQIYVRYSIIKRFFFSLNRFFRYPKMNCTFLYSIVEYDPLLDSSNMFHDHWIRIAGDIEVKL